MEPTPRAMDPALEPCPDDDAFAAFLEQRVSEHERAAFEGHLDACPRCFATFVELALSPGASSRPRTRPP